MTTYRVVNVYIAEKMNGAYPSCDHCGHDIRQVYVIADEAGAQMQVGSDCVRMLTARTEAYATAERWEKRFSRAASQWRAAQSKPNYPQPMAGESREQYINRRVHEMARGLAAGKAWHAHYNKMFQARGHIGLIYARMWDLKVVLRAERLGLTIERTAVIRRHAERHARRWNANPFDFRRPIWELIKL